MDCSCRLGRQPPNKRLKLAGGDRFKGNGALCPDGHGLSSITLAPAGRAPPGLGRSRWGPASLGSSIVHKRRPGGKTVAWGKIVVPGGGATVKKKTVDGC